MLKQVNKLYTLKAAKKSIRCKPVSGLIPGNPNNTILDFENKFLDFICDNDRRNQYQAVLVDSATNAIELCCMLNKIENKKITFNIPTNTYISVPQAVGKHYKYNLVDKQWDDWYLMGNIIDCAGYMPTGEELHRMLSNMVADYVILSFGNAKPFPMNKGGLIIFNKKKLKLKSVYYSLEVNEYFDTIDRYDVLKRLSHDGRDSALPVYDDELLMVKNKMIGKKCNLVPEQVKPYLYKLLDYQDDRETFRAMLQKHRVGSIKYPNIKLKYC